MHAWYGRLSSGISSRGLSRATSTRDHRSKTIASEGVPDRARVFCFFLEVQRWWMIKLQEVTDCSKASCSKCFCLPKYVCTIRALWIIMVATNLPLDPTLRDLMWYCMSLLSQPMNPLRTRKLISCLGFLWRPWYRTRLLQHTRLQELLTRRVVSLSTLVENTTGDFAYSQSSRRHCNTDR